MARNSAPLRGVMLSLGLTLGACLDFASPPAAFAAPKTSVPGSFESPPPPTLAWPAGAGRALVETRCLFCHHAELIVAQRLTPAQWDKEVIKMVKWGAPLTSEEQKVLAAYLAAHWGPERPGERPATLDLRGRR